MKKLMLFAALVLAVGCSKAAVKPEEKMAAGDPACSMHAGMQKMAAADAVATKAFDHAPKIGETAQCAVSGEKFVVAAESKTAEYNGKWYAFCCDECGPDFAKDPAKYAEK